MLRVIPLTCATILMLLFTPPQSSRFSNYKTLEAYEIRPGILMMPSYTGDGQVCEIGLQVRHYSPEKVRLDSSLSRKEIDQIFEELVPDNERGPMSKDIMNKLTVKNGVASIDNAIFENVTIEVYSEASISVKTSGRILQDAVVATASWKNRKCREDVVPSPEKSCQLNRSMQHHLL